MGELRWVLLGLGAAILLLVYAWGKGYFGRIRPSWLKRTSASTGRRVEPSLDSPDLPGEASDGEIPGNDTAEAAPTIVERIVTIRFIPHDKTIGSDRVVLALRAAGLRHGRYGIFHMNADDRGDEPLFSVANLTEPGSFDLSRLSETAIQGMSFFMVLPGTGDPVIRFDRMIDTARLLARDLNAELHDDKGSSWSVQRERYIREEMIQYRHQLTRAADLE